MTNSNTQPPISQAIEYICSCVGEENAVTSRTIEALFNIQGTELRVEINRCRSLGIPICSTRNGYFYASNRRELIETIESMQSRIRSIQCATNGLLETLSGDRFGTDDVL